MLFNRLPEPLVALRRGKGAIHGGGAFHRRAKRAPRPDSGELMARLASVPRTPIWHFSLKNCGVSLLSLRSAKPCLPQRFFVQLLLPLAAVGGSRGTNVNPGPGLATRQGHPFSHSAVRHPGPGPATRQGHPFSHAAVRNPGPEAPPQPCLEPQAASSHELAPRCWPQTLAEKTPPARRGGGCLTVVSLAQVVRL